MADMNTKQQAAQQFWDNYKTIFTSLLQEDRFDGPLTPLQVHNMAYLTAKSQAVYESGLLFNFGSFANEEAKIAFKDQLASIGWGGMKNQSEILGNYFDYMKSNRQITVKKADKLAAAKAFDAAEEYMQKLGPNYTSRALNAIGFETHAELNPRKHAMSPSVDEKGAFQVEPKKIPLEPTIEPTRAYTEEEARRIFTNRFVAASEFINANSGMFNNIEGAEGKGLGSTNYSKLYQLAGDVAKLYTAHDTGYVMHFDDPRLTDMGDDIRRVVAGIAHDDLGYEGTAKFASYADVAKVISNEAVVQSTVDELGAAMLHQQGRELADGVVDSSSLNLIRMRMKEQAEKNFAILQEMDGAGSQAEFMNDIRHAEFYNVDPEQFAKTKVYRAGAVAKRINNTNNLDDFYEENRFAHTEDVIYRYNGGMSEDLAPTKLHDIESEFINSHAERMKEFEKLTTGQQSLSAAEPDAVRTRILDARDEAIRENTKVRSDRREIGAMMDVLRTHTQEGTPIMDVLKADKYKGLQLAQYVLNSNSADNAQALSAIVRGINHFADGVDESGKPVMKQILNYRITPRTAIEHTDPQLMLDHLNRALVDSWDTEDIRYGRAARAGEFIGEYYNMMNDLYAERKMLDQEFIGYINRAEENAFGSMGREEYQRIQDHTRRLVETAEANDRFFEEHTATMKELLSENTSLSNNEGRPLSPINQIRGAIVKTLYGVDENESRKAAEGALDLLRNKDAIVAKWTDMDRMHGEALQMDYQMRRDKAKEEFKDQVRRPNQGSEKGLRRYLETQFVKDEANPNKISLDSAEALEKTWGKNGENYSTIRAGLEKGRKDAFEVITANEFNDAHYAAWNAVDEDQRLRVPGDRVARRKVGMDGNYVKLEAEHAFANTAEVNLKIRPDELMNVLSQLDEYKFKSEISKEQIKEQADRVHKEGFIDLIYEQQWVNEDMKAKNEERFNFLKEAETHAKMTAQRMGRDINHVNVQVSAASLLENFNIYMKNIDDGSTRAGVERKQKRVAPEFIQSMIDSHSNWMKSLGNADEIMSSSYLALAESVNRIAQGQMKVDLTDDGFKELWRLQGKTDDEIANLSEKMAGKGMKERLEQHLFLNVMGDLHQKWFEFNENNGNESVRNLLYHIQDEIVNAGKMSGDNFKGLATEIKDHAMKARPTFELFPFYSQVLRMQDGEIADMLRERDSLGASVLSLDEMIQRTFNTDSYDDLNELAEDLDNKEAKANMNPAMRRSFNVSDENKELTAKVLKYISGNNGKENVYKEGLQALKQEAADTVAEWKASGKNDIGLMLDINKMRGIDHAEGTVMYEGERRNAIFRYGNKGDILAEIPDFGTEIKMVNNALELQESHLTSNLKVTSMNGGRVVQDIVNPGPLLQEFPMVYDDVQMKGRGFRTQANPADTLNLMDNFMKGNQSMTYFDLETTGVDNSMLPKRMLQPLELYAQKMEWDPSKNDFARVGREIAATGPDGKLAVQSQHLFMGLDDDMKKYMGQLTSKEGQGYAARFQTELTQDMVDSINKLDLGVQYDVVNKTAGNGSKYSVNALSAQEYAMLDRRGKQAVSNALHAFGADGKRVAKNLEKQDSRLWFLRNVAKFAKNENYGTYAGDEAAPIKRGNAYGGKTFMDKLAEDAATGAKNLDLVGETDSAGRARVRFSPGQERVTRGEMVQKFVAFAGNDPIAGQNVAEADWAKIKTAAGEAAGQTFDEFQQTTQRIKDQLQGMKDTIINNFAEKEGIDYDSAATRLQSQVDGVSKRGWRLGNRKKNVYELGQMMDFQDIADRVDKGQLGGIRNKKGKLKGANQDLLKQINTLADKLGYDIDTTSIGDSIRAVNASESFMNNMKDPRIMEQMFLSKMANPNAKSHAAEAQNEAAGTVGKVKGPAHRADVDVKTGMETMGEWMRRVSDKLDGFTPTELNQGAIVEQTRQFAKNMPLGLYQVNEVRDNAIDFQRINADGSLGDVHTLDAPTGHELARRYYEHFNFIDDGSMPVKAKQAAKEYAEDAARQYLGVAGRSAHNFELHQLHAGEISTPDITGSRDHYAIRNEPIQRMQDTYDRMAANPNATPSNVAEETALNNARLFGGTDATDMLNEQTSERQRAGFGLLNGKSRPGKSTPSYYDSVEGQKTKAFLNDVRSLEETGVINGSERRQALRDYHDSIKEEGKKAGYTRALRKQAAVKVPIDGFGDNGGGTFKLDMRNERSAAQSIWGMAQSMQDLGRQELIRMGQAAPTEQEARGRALNQFVMPLLRDQGLIDDYVTDGNLDNTPKVAEAARQIMEREIVEPGAPRVDGGKYAEQFYQYDSLGYNKHAENAEFMKFMDDTHAKILDDYKKNISPVQQLKANVLNDTREKLMAEGMYHPGMKIDPRIGGVDLDTVVLDPQGGFRSMSPNVLTDILQGMNTMSAPDVSTKNEIFRSLFYQATRGNRNSIEGMFGAADDPTRLQAMKALNWVTEATPEIKDAYKAQIDKLSSDLLTHETNIATMTNPNDINYVNETRMRDRVSGQLNNLSQQLDLAEKTGHVWNPNTAEWIYGMGGDYAGFKVGDLPKTIVEGVVAANDPRYTRNSGMGLMHGRLSQWLKDGMPGRSDNAPERPLSFQYEAMTEQELVDSGSTRDEARSMLRDYHNYLKEIGADPRVNEKGEPTILNRVAASTEPSKGPPDGMLRKYLNRGTDKAKGLVESFATAVDNLAGFKKAGAWAAGIGLGAYALNQFFSAGDSLKVERQPMGHGGTTVGGYAEDDDSNKMQRETKSYQASNPANATYVHSGGGGKGKTVKATAIDNGRGVDYDQMAQKLNGNAQQLNINLTDNMTKMDRKYLETQMDNYISRGHA